MNIFLFGATGGTGKEIMIKLLEHNCPVFVLARNPDAISIRHHHLTIIKGGVYDTETYEEQLSTCDVVISALGTGTSRRPTEIYSKGGQQIIAVMQKTGVKRLVTLTAGAFDPTGPATRSRIIKYIVQPLFKNIYADMQKWERILESSKDIDWTIIRPSRLTNGKERGSYRTLQDHCPKGGSKISRRDLADFIIKHAVAPKYIHQKVAVAY